MKRKWTARIGMAGMLLMVIISACEKNELLTGSREGDDKKLEQLRQEIDVLAEQYPCENPDEWRFAPIGHKSCGGPTAYIAYSTKLDTVSFLKKVETYTNVQKAYNEKWQVASFCDYLTPPSHVVCEDGKPTLVWGGEF